jgi:hypothetical protein
MGSYGGMILTGKTEELGEKPFPAPLCQKEIMLSGYYPLLYV